MTLNGLMRICLYQLTNRQMRPCGRVYRFDSMLGLGPCGPVLRTAIGRRRSPPSPVPWPVMAHAQPQVGALSLPIPREALSTSLTAGRVTGPQHGMALWLGASPSVPTTAPAKASGIQAHRQDQSSDSSNLHSLKFDANSMFSIC